MIFSYNWLKTYLAGSVPKPEKLRECIALHSFEVEKMQKKGTDWIFDIDILPNRAHDAFSYLGMAREITALLPKVSLSLPKQEKIKVEKGNLKRLKVSIAVKNKVPRYHAAVIEGVKIAKAPAWMLERLEQNGINSINSIVDITNYVMLETGHPLHAFDYDKVKGSVMKVRSSKKGEKITTLDENTYELQDGALVIEDATRLIDLVGIMGGNNSRIEEDTINIVLQASSFDRLSIYRAAKSTGLATDAAHLYSCGLDPNLAEEGLRRAVNLIQEIAGGRVVQLIDIYPHKVSPRVIQLDIVYLQSLLGVSISAKEAVLILERLGCKVKKAQQKLAVTVPTRRLDLEIPEDLIEEVGRIYGYERIESTPAVGSFLPAEQGSLIFWQEKIRDSLKEAGMTEVITYSFVGEEDMENFQYSKKDRAALLELANPLSSEFKFLRSILLENLVKVAARNQKVKKDIRIFESGTVFQKGRKEEDMVAGIISGDAFFEAKGVVDFLLERLGVPGVWYDSYQATPEWSRDAIWHKGRTAEIKVGNKEIGFVGEINPAILRRLKITGRIAGFQLHMGKLAELALEEKEYRPISRFPSVIRDVSVLVPRDVKVVDVLNVMNIAGGSLVVDIDLFDMYEGDEIGEGRKNFAFHVVYQSDKKTLSGKEVDVVHQKIIKSLASNEEWETRE